MQLPVHTFTIDTQGTRSRIEPRVARDHLRFTTDPITDQTAIGGLGCRLARPRRQSCRSGSAAAGPHAELSVTQTAPVRSAAPGLSDLSHPSIAASELSPALRYVVRDICPGRLTESRKQNAYGQTPGGQTGEITPGQTKD